MKFSFKTALVLLAAVASLSASAQRGGRTFADADLDFNFVEDRPGRDFDFRNDRGNQRQVKRFELDMYEDVYMEGDVIRLKRMLNNQFPRRNFANFRLKAVVLVAKAGRRGLDAQVVGKQGNKSRYKALPFNGRGTMRNPGNYDRVRFRMQQNLGRGRLQVHFSGAGRAKIKKIIVRAERVRGGGNNRLQYTQIDEFRTEKFFQITQRIRVRQQDVKAIRLSASRNDVDVQQVMVVYGNGDVDYLPGLEGVIYEDNNKTVKLGRRGQTVRRIEIMATSLSPFGSRGKLAVSIGK